MRSPFPRKTIRPKLTAMPRQQSEATAYLRVYQLVVEKQRLQQELQTIESRHQQICQRLDVLDKEIAGAEDAAHQLRANTPYAQQTPALAEGAGSQLQKDAANQPESNFETVVLEY